MKVAKILFVILTIFLYSCALFYDLTIRADKRTFEKEHNLWNNQNLKNYQFTYKYFSSGTGPIGPIKITVTENEEPIIENQYNEDFILKTIPEIYDYISGTFDYIESVKNGTYDGHKIRSITLDISYDTMYHYPKKVDLSTGYVESVAGGAYYTLEITDFSTLQP
ncbi:MAG: DUF6174 domain-containing protein [Fibromonadaceae bacterium]|jgi:hypothetical protein|nr:DUF6174 domain-containing protein [Fibromonadaceae bacterium]